MIYKFKSKAAGDVVMTGPAGDDLLRVIGKTPAPQGIVEVGSIGVAIAAIEHAVAADEAHHDQEHRARRSYRRSR